MGLGRSPQPTLGYIEQKIYDRYNKRSEFISGRELIAITRDRKSIHEYRGVESIRIFCCTYYKSILLQLVIDPK